MARNIKKISKEFFLQHAGFVEFFIQNLGYEHVVINKFNVATNALMQKLYTRKAYSSANVADNNSCFLKDFIVFNPIKSKKYIIMECSSDEGVDSASFFGFKNNACFDGKNLNQTIVVLDITKITNVAIPLPIFQGKIDINLSGIFCNFFEFKLWAVENL